MLNRTANNPLLCFFIKFLGALSKCYSIWVIIVLDYWRKAPFWAESYEISFLASLKASIILLCSTLAASNFFFPSEACSSKARILSLASLTSRYLLSSWVFLLSIYPDNVGKVRSAWAILSFKLLISPSNSDYLTSQPAYFWPNS